MEELIKQMQQMVENQARIIKENAELKSMLTRLLERGEGPKDVMNTDEVSEYLNITPQRVRALVSKNEIPFFKNEGGTRNYFRREDIDNWRAKRRVKTNAELNLEVSTKLAMARI